MTKFGNELTKTLNVLERHSQKNVKNWFKDFPKYSTECLLNLDATPFQDPKVLASLFKSKTWPVQQFNSGHFADLSFTLYRNENFLLDLYIWHHQDTNIHDHHFSGAFKIIQGESYHISYDYHETKNIYPWLSEGKLVVREKLNLFSGDVKTILFTKDFIHQNMHTTNPCVTLCLRTIDHPKIRLSSYYNLGMKIKMHPMSHSELKILEGIMHLCSFSNDQSSILKILSKLPDITLYSTMTGQYPFFNRAPPIFHQAIQDELIKRDESLFTWVKKVLNNQMRLNSQLSSMLKS